MINVSTISEQIRVWLEEDVNLQGFEITRGEILNEDPGKGSEGWIGIYRRDIDYSPRNLGVPPNNYEADFIFDIIVQRTSLKSGKDCEDILEESLKYVLDRIVQIPRTYIDTFTSLSVSYAYLETDRSTMYFQGALISLVSKVSMEVK